MTTVQIALPDDVFSSMHKSPGEVADEMRVAAATIWYAKGLISQGQGAEIAGMSRADFMQTLSDAGVSPFQETLDEIHSRRVGAYRTLR
jgi:predicted HTH domain antitoxin